MPQRIGNETKNHQCCALIALLLMRIVAVSAAVFMLASVWLAYHNPRPTTQHLVCCAYNENLQWLHQAARHYDKVYLYMKNKQRLPALAQEFHEPNIELIPFDNIGSCDHIYLHHIIHHYEALADRMAFFKGKHFNHPRRYQYLSIPCPQYAEFFNSSDVQHVKKNISDFYLDTWDFHNNPGLSFEYQKSDYACLYDFLCHKFSPQQASALITYATLIIYGGNFIVDRHNIHRYPKEVYESLIDWETPGPNREIDHFHERIWGLLFSSAHPNPLARSTDYNQSR